MSLVFLNQGIRLEQGELKARFDSDAVHVDRLVFSAPYQPPPRDKLFADYSLPAGTGRMSASGRIDLNGDSSDLQITADHLPLAQRADRWIIASGSGHARYASKILMLDGNIRADAGLINQPVSDRPAFRRRADHRKGSGRPVGSADQGECHTGFGRPLLYTCVGIRGAFGRQPDHARRTR